MRNIAKYKVYSLFTISGLAIGLTFFIFSTLYVDFSLNFDTFHKNADRIYGIVQVLHSSNEGEQHSAITPGPLLPALLNEFPEIENATRFFYSGNNVVKYHDKVFYENGVLYGDQNFLSLFTYKIITGNPETVLSEPNSIILTESSVLKYFGNENPIGKSLTFNNTMDVTVTGIIEDVPLNSSFRFDFLISMKTVRSNWINDWTSYNMATFLLLPEGYDPAQLEQKFPDFIKKCPKRTVFNIKFY